MGLLSYGYKLWKTGKKTSPTISSVKPSVPKTKLEKATSNLNIAKQKTKASKAKLNQTLFNIDQASKKAKEVAKDKRNEKIVKKFIGEKQETKTKHFYAPKNFNKGGRVGLKKGSFPDHSGDGKITQKDILIAKGVIPKKKNKKKII